MLTLSAPQFPTKSVMEDKGNNTCEVFLHAQAGSDQYSVPLVPSSSLVHPTLGASVFAALGDPGRKVEETRPGQTSLRTFEGENPL